MPTPIAPRIILAQNAQLELQTLARAHSTPQSLALRARMVLRTAAVEQPTHLQIGHELGCSNLTWANGDGATWNWAAPVCTMPVARGGPVPGSAVAICPR